MTKELLNYLLIAETVPLAVGLIQIVFISMPFSGCLCVCVCVCKCVLVCFLFVCLFVCLLACFMVCLLACMFRMRPYLKTQDFKEELCSKLCMAVDKFSPNRQWQIETWSAKVHLWSLKFNMGPQNQPLGKEMLNLKPSFSGSDSFRQIFGVQPWIARCELLHWETQTLLPVTGCKWFFFIMYIVCFINIHLLSPIYGSFFLMCVFFQL